MAQGFNGYPNVIIPNFINGVGAPSVTPQIIGQTYIDTSNRSVYIATATDGPWAWAYSGQGSLSSFTVSTIPGIFAWYDATNVSSITKDGSSRITSWNDISGNGRHLIYTTTTPAMDPTYSPVHTPNGINSNYTAFFDGALSKRMWTAGWTAVAQPFTWIIVIKPTNIGTGTWQVFHDGATAGSSYRNAMMKDTGTTNGAMTAGTAATITPAFDNTSQIRISCFNGASSYHQKNNLAPMTVSVGTNSLGGIILGADYGVSSFAYSHIGEVIVYNRSLSTVELNTVLNYTNNKWGIY